MFSPGKLFVVVGPSGVGKDSLMNYAKTRLIDIPRIHFVRRTITRPVESGGEDHDQVSSGQFAEMERSGAFAVSWEAHGLHYGIPAALKDRVAEGQIAIVNGSRHALPQMAQTFPGLVIVSVTARPEVLAERLRMRGRETEEEIGRRLARSEADFSALGTVVTIDNSGTIETGGELLVNLLANANLKETQANDESQNADSALGRFMNNAAMCL